MTLQFYMDVHVPATVSDGLRLRGIDVLTCQADGRVRATDEGLLERAHELERVLFSQDEDLLEISARWTTGGREFAGVIYCHQLAAGIGRIVSDLELIAKVMSLAEVRSQVIYIPLH